MQTLIHHSTNYKLFKKQSIFIPSLQTPQLRQQKRRQQVITACPKLGTNVLLQYGILPALNYNTA